MKKDNTVCVQEIMENQQSRATVFAITSGKGGVGKSNIAANLAICLSALRKRVVLIDADLSLANLDIVMNITGRYNISHVISGQKSMEEITHIGPEGVEVICGASGLEGLADISQFERHRLLAEFDKLGNDCDAVIIDTGAGIDKSVVGFCLASDHTLVVTTPEPPAMADAYAMIKVLTANKFGGRISLIVNMAGSVAEGKRVYRQITEVAKRFLNADVYQAGVLLRDEKLCESVRQRKAVVLAYPKSRITLSLAAMATRLSKGWQVPERREGFFRKVVNWFF